MLWFYRCVEKRSTTNLAHKPRRDLKVKVESILLRPSSEAESFCNDVL